MLQVLADRSENVRRGHANRELSACVGPSRANLPWSNFSGWRMNPQVAWSPQPPPAAAWGSSISSVDGHLTRATGPLCPPPGVQGPVFGYSWPSVAWTVPYLVRAWLEWS